MSQVRKYSSPLRQRQFEETRSLMVQSALEMISGEPEELLTHEAIARRVQVGLRTVYRYFPSKADLIEAVWQETSKRLQLTSFPDTEETLLDAVAPVFRRMDENATLMRGLLRSSPGDMLRKDYDRRRSDVIDALTQATKHLPKGERLRVVGVFQTLFSARAWEIMRDRTHLKEGEPAKAVLWAMKTLLDSLYREQRRALKTEIRKEGLPSKSQKS